MGQKARFWITASHVPVVKNTTADLRSRLFYNNKEWSLNERVAKALFDQFGKPEIDMFASRLNTRCTKYASYKPDPDAYHVNAFSLCWLNLNSYIFPPFSIVGRVLAKLAQDQATALVIVPRWQTQPWFPRFVQLVKPGTTLLLIPTHQHLLQLPGTNLGHPTWDWFSLVAAILSGTSQQRDYHLTSPRSSEHHGGSAQSVYNTPVQRWLDFCNSWQLNPHQPTVSQVLDFLHTLHELGLSYSAIGTHQSAISAILEFPGVPQLGKHCLVSRFMKGIFHLRPPQTRHTKTWNVNKVDNCLIWKVLDQMTYSFWSNWHWNQQPCWQS